jgi:hypothetical protein
MGADLEGMRAGASLGLELGRKSPPLNERRERVGVSYERASAARAGVPERYALFGTDDFDESCGRPSRENDELTRSRGMALGGTRAASSDGLLRE